MACARSESNAASEAALPWRGYSGVSVFGVGEWLSAADVPSGIRSGARRGC